MQIQVKSGVELSSYTPAGLAFNDGTKLDADVIVFATGFEGNVRGEVSQLVDAKAAAGLDDYWGLDEEGNTRGAWRPMAREFDSSLLVDLELELTTLCFFLQNLMFGILEELFRWRGSTVASWPCKFWRMFVACPCVLPRRACSLITW